MIEEIKMHLNLRQFQTSKRIRFDTFSFSHCFRRRTNTTLTNCVIVSRCSVYKNSLRNRWQESFVLDCEKSNIFLFSLLNISILLRINWFYIDKHAFTWRHWNSDGLDPMTSIRFLLRQKIQGSRSYIFRSRTRENALYFISLSHRERH